MFTGVMNEHGPTSTNLGALLTEQQLAEEWNTTTRHLRRLRLEGGLPFVKLGRLVRFDPRDVAGWVVAHKRDSGLS